MLTSKRKKSYCFSKSSHGVRSEGCQSCNHVSALSKGVESKAVETKNILPIGWFGTRFMIAKQLVYKWSFKPGFRCCPQHFHTKSHVYLKKGIRMASHLSDAARSCHCHSPPPPTHPILITRLQDDKFYESDDKFYESDDKQYNPPPRSDGSGGFNICTARRTIRSDPKTNMRKKHTKRKCAVLQL